MKTLATQTGARRGIAMTEYLIILAIVAVAAIAIVGLFGKQIKQVFTSNTAAMAGNVQQNTSAADEGAVKRDDMGSFVNNVTSNN
jgi:Flp pilus assembly pilin Flp